jgi:hypothetical protein
LLRWDPPPGVHMAAAPSAGPSHQRRRRPRRPEMPPRGAAALLLLLVLCGASSRFFLVSFFVLCVFSGSGCNAGENSSADCVLPVGSPGRSGGHGVRGKFHWSCRVRGRRWFRLFLHGAVALVIRPSASESCLRLSLWHVKVGIPSEKSALRFFRFGAAGGDSWHGVVRVRRSRSCWVVKTASEVTTGAMMPVWHFLSHTDLEVFRLCQFVQVLGEGLGSSFFCCLFNSC